jgi:hypothetical protein
MLKELESISNKLNEALSVLVQTLDRLTEEQADEVKITSEWSARDEIAHLAGANRGMYAIAQKMAAGQDPQLRPDYDNDFYNARQVAKRKGKSLADLRQEIEEAHAELIGFLDSLTQEQLDLMGQHPIYGHVKLKELLVIIYSHETTHTREISDKIRESKK